MSIRDLAAADAYQMLAWEGDHVRIMAGGRGAPSDEILCIFGTASDQAIVIGQSTIGQQDRCQGMLALEDVQQVLTAQGTTRRLQPGDVIISEADGEYAGHWRIESAAVDGGRLIDCQLVRQRITSAGAGRTGGTDA
jgi:hypothetical protein